MNKNDKIFNKKMNQVEPFEFNQNVVDVFDDMIARSVPFYNEIHQLIIDILRKLNNTSKIYDLGCSTGTTAHLIYDYYQKQSKKIPEIIGLDSSIPMIQKAKRKCDEKPQISFQQADINEYSFDKCDVIIMNYTLQFIKPDKRMALIQQLYKCLNPGGVLILSEKIKCKQEKFDELFIDLYYDFKRRNGYSELEISQKREALENVLIPSTISENQELLYKGGFTDNEVLFKWYNFACFLGIKE